MQRLVVSRIERSFGCGTTERACYFFVHQIAIGGVVVDANLA